MTKLFGTDGIRGEANTPPMNAEVALKVAMAAATVLRRGDHRHTVLIGKDTRLSGYLLEPALTAGFIGMGMDVWLVGPLPTPAIAMLTRSMRADLGVMISASHNPYHDNGLKFFGPDGCKLSDALEAAIEARVVQPFTELPTGEGLGRATRLEDAAGRYIENVKQTFPRALRLDGFKLVVDCAHGAAYKVAPRVLYELGAEVIALNAAPNGRNINAQCGATHPEDLQERVRSEQAHLGIALDGDADRLILVDENGTVVDGDQVMGLIARTMQAAGTLRGGLVATVMSNLGLERYMAQQNIPFARTAVGDRHILAHQRETGWNVGGEQSGHIILTDHSTTGDGLVAALQVLAALVESGRKASDLCQVFTPVPQLLRNVRYAKGQAPLETTPVQKAIAAAEASLAGQGRLLVRKSGTEPLIRVMAEGDDAAVVEAAVAQVIAAVDAAA